MKPRLSVIRWSKIGAQTGLVFWGAHIVREAAYFYQRYVFFNGLGAGEFGIATMAIAPAMFAATLFTMISGELVITHLSSPEDGQEERDHALKYILAVEIVAGLTATVGLMLVALAAPVGGVRSRPYMLASVLIIPTMMFSQIASNWSLLRDRRRLYSTAFIAQGAMAFLTARPLLAHLGGLGFVVAQALNPVPLSIVILLGAGVHRARDTIQRVWIRGSARKGRRVHLQAGHQVGSLLAKTAWGTLDVLTVGWLGGAAAAGQYRMLKTLGGIPSVLMSPVWTWIRPEVAAAVRRRAYRPMAISLLRYSMALTTPAVIMVFIPAWVYAAAYNSAFRGDALDGFTVKLSLILWWLVASLSGWARYFAVVTRNLQLSTYASIFMCFATFCAGPILVVLFGFDARFTVPVALVLTAGYWWISLGRLVQGRSRSSVRLRPVIE